MPLCVSASHPGEGGSPPVLMRIEELRHHLRIELAVAEAPRMRSSFFSSSKTSDRCKRWVGEMWEIEWRFQSNHTANADGRKKNNLDLDETLESVIIGLLCFDVEIGLWPSVVSFFRAGTEPLRFCHGQVWADQDIDREETAGAASRHRPRAHTRNQTRTQRQCSADDKCTQKHCFGTPVCH